MAPLVWFITGCSTGFGNELVKYALSQGDKVVATARKPDSLSFPGGDASNLLTLPLDVTKAETISSALSAAQDKFSKIDILVNNAGYGLSGEFEALTDAQVRTQMEVNFFGLIDVTRAAMPIMRDQKGGLIMQVTSIGGQRGVPTFSIYCASKWAVEGFTEAVSNEVKPEWGVRFCCVEPGGFRTDWAGRSMIFADRHEAYDHINAKENMGKRHGTQVGDPPKAAKAMWELGHMDRDEVPLRVILGSDAYGAMQTKMQTYNESLKKFEKLSKSTDVDEDKK